MSKLTNLSGVSPDVLLFEEMLAPLAALTIAAQILPKTGVPQVFSP